VAVSGPIIKDQTFFFVDVESTRDDKDNRLTAPLLGVNETIQGESRFDYLTVRLDQSWSEDWSSTLRINRGDVEVERQGGGLTGGLTFPSAGDVQDRESNLTAFTTRYSGARFSYVGELQYATFDWNFGDAKVDGAQATLLGPTGNNTIGVIGNNGFFFDLDERTIQTKQKLTFNFDRWRLNTGIDYMNADFKLTGGGNPAGNYTVRLNDAQLAAVRALNRGASLGVNDIPANVQVVRYDVELRPARFGTDQTLIGLWTEAQVDFTEKLTANFGLRYDYDDLTKFGTGDADDDNVSPRFGFNYRLSDTRAIRGGAGIFYEKLPYVVISDAFQRNADTPGFRQQLQQLVALGRLPANTNLDRVVRNGNLTVSPTAPGFLQGPTGTQLAGQGNNISAGERQIINPFGYDNPYSVQFSVGYQQAFADAWLFETNVIYNRGHDLVRLIDVNSPEPYAGISAQQAATLTPAQLQALVRTQAQADATRPTQAPPGGANSILISDTGGKSEYRALTLGITKERAGDFYGGRISYTLSKLENDTDDINFRAQDANNFDDEFAPSLNDRKHVVSAILYLYPLEDLSLSLAGLYQSGQPTNFGPDSAIFGTDDLNGDGRSFTNQFTGNPDRAPGRGRNSGRLPSSTTFDLGAQYRLPMFGTGKLELSVDVFNLFNEVNLGGYTVNATASNQFQVAGRPFQTRSADRPRTFQFGARYLF
jgi:hypothetical protein